MNPCTEIRGDEKVRLRPVHQYDDEYGHEYDDDGDDVDDDKHDGGYHAYIQKAGFAGSQKPQITLNFPQKDCLKTRKLSIP